MPSIHSPTPPGVYDIYPGFDIGNGKIQLGYHYLAERIASHTTVIIDGYIGLFWDHIRECTESCLQSLGISANWVDVSKALRSEGDINRMVEPYLGGDDPIFGTRYTGTIEDFFDNNLIQKMQPDAQYPVNIIYGCGAALAGWDGLFVYIDLPKNEIQFRSRAGRVCNLGMDKPQPPKVQYKRFYFLDWVVLNKHKENLLPGIDLIVDGQRPDEPAITEGNELRNVLSLMGRNYFRVRPWFEPGPWGGQWIKEHIPGLSPDVPNYAWSFELIVPENGLLLESDRRLLEVSHDFLMFQEYQNVLGNSAEFFKYEFPIRYDFLDTFDGGNLSVQCHPRSEFIKDNFGENYTQDECYYILDCKPGAGVYIGFRDGINPLEFREALEGSFYDKEPVDIQKFVNFENANKHDLFLIPNGTIHGSGTDNLVLEISNTPYIFTFKMYDWMRMDLDGKPRPLNIDRAFKNLYFERQGEVVKEEHIAKPRIIKEGTDWQVLHLPTHREHIYDVHRFEFKSTVEDETNGSPHIMSLVEGKSVILETSAGMRTRFNYAETFVIPAGAEAYRLISEDSKPLKVVKTFLK
jgi:mannose-6-phosphate isomerase class I